MRTPRGFCWQPARRSERVFHEVDEKHDAKTSAMNGPGSWWKSAVIYQVYPRSFQDTDDNGVGDLNGITERLRYFIALGVDAIWISPIFHRRWPILVMTFRITSTLIRSSAAWTISTG
jgi:hypothetical protein